MDDAVSAALRASCDGRLADWGNRLQHLLDLPSNIALDPLRATDPRSGRFLPEAVSRVAVEMRHLGLSAARLVRPRWNTSDLGGGLERNDLRALLDDIGVLRQALS
jgi:hypothetical protein